MSRVQDLLDRVEKMAKKFEMSVEDVISILEGKSTTHKVVSVNPPVAASAPSSVTLTNANPTTSGPAAASVGTQEASAVTTAVDSGSAVNPTVAASAGSSEESSAAAE